uniref:uncharacterized protein LOC120833875 n=1 Tax=Gasterosteus aculeatus aculeatus TaxID=481459 RepID=UPI001A988FFF|nr:uncharacterized protein LOC120833875 [Gasterosteus aculeatus aculeatus]
MVIMFHLNQAALLSITLFTMVQVSADSNAVEQRNISVYRGESVTFTCNVSKTKVSQIRWTKGGSSFVFGVPLNQTFSNFTSHRLTIDTNFPSKMIISNFQHNDAGIYRCTLYDEKGTRSIEWNVTVSEEHEEFSYLWLYITTATGSLLSFFITAVCLYRSWTKIPDQDQERKTLSYVTFHLQCGKEVAPLQPHSCVEYSKNHKSIL